MFFWAILLIFALPLVQYLLKLMSDKKETDLKLKKIQKRLKQLEENSKE